MSHRHYLLILAGIFAVVWASLAVAPSSRGDWALENALVLVFVVVLAASYRHFTLSRAMWGSDHGASLEPEGLRRLVKYIRTVERALGDGQKVIYEGEAINAAKFRKTALQSAQ